MWDYRLVRCPLYLFALVSSVSGCQLFHDYRPVTVLVRNAETKKPIPGAEVGIIYLSMLDPFAPWSSSGKTDDDGVVHLSAAPYRCARMSAEANGYLMEDRDVAVQEILNIEPENPFKLKNPRRITHVVEMYSEPRPTIELIVPNGYRGLIKVEIMPLDDSRCTPGQRQFTYHVPPSGVVEMKGPRLLHHLSCTDYSARYEDATPLDAFAPGNAVGFRWLTCVSRDDEYFVVGTHSDYNKSYRLFHKKNSEGAWYLDHEAAEAWTSQHRTAGPF